MKTETILTFEDYISPLIRVIIKNKTEIITNKIYPKNFPFKSILVSEGLPSDSNYIYQGVGSKMFAYFTRKYEPTTVISFADRRWTPWIDNNLYTKIGFQLDSITRPDYTYYNENIERYKRFHKMSMSKKVLCKKYGFPMTMTELEMAKSLGYDRIWNCGLFKYVWKRR